MKRLVILIIACVLAAGILLFHKYGRSIWVPVYTKIKGKQTVEQVMGKITFINHPDINDYSASDSEARKMALSLL